MANAIVSVAKSLGMTVTATGVENKEQFEFLKELGCEHAQGFYISKPLTFADALHFKKVWNYSHFCSQVLKTNE